MIRMGREEELSELYALARSRLSRGSKPHKRLLELLDKHTPWKSVTSNSSRGAIFTALSNGATIDSKGGFVLNGEARRAVVTNRKAMLFFHANQQLISGQTAARETLFTRVKLPKSGPFFKGPKMPSWKSQSGRHGRRLR